MRTKLIEVPNGKVCVDLGRVCRDGRWSVTIMGTPKKFDAATDRTLWMTGCPEIISATKSLGLDGVDLLDMRTSLDKMVAAAERVKTTTRTIGKYLLVFSTHEGYTDVNSIHYNTYSGAVVGIPHDIASEIAEYHPKTQEYSEKTLSPLYQTYGKYRGGSECPIFAISTKCKYPFVNITRL